MCWRPSAARQTASRRSIAFSCGTGRSTAGPTSRPLSRRSKTSPSPRSSGGCTRASSSWTQPMPRESSRLMQLADARDIPVFWLLPPLVAGPSSPARPERRRGRATNSSSGRSWRAIRDILTVLDARRGGLPAVVIHGPYPFERSRRDRSVSCCRQGRPTAPRPPAIARALPSGSRWPSPPIIPPNPASSSRTSSNRGRFSISAQPPLLRHVEPRLGSPAEGPQSCLRSQTISDRSRRIPILQPADE